MKGPLVPISRGRALRRTFGLFPLALALTAGLLGVPSTAQATPLPRSISLTAAAAPSLLSAGSTELAIDWADFNAAPAYRVRYSKYSSLKKSTYKRVAASEIVLTKLKASTKYYVRVQAIQSDSKGTPLSAYSAKKTFKTAKKLKYAAPTGVTAAPSARGADAIAAQWSYYKSGMRYQVQYGTSPDFLSAAWTIARGPSVALTGLAESATYYLRVRSLDGSGNPTSSWSRAVSAQTRTPADPGAKPLQVASFNIRNGTKSSDTGSRAWPVRRGVIVNQIRNAGLDVVGLQEAEYTYLTGADGGWKHQYQDLIEVLGGAWKITCATDSNPNCDRSENYTAGTRVIYNSATVIMRDRGTVELSSRSGDVRRFMVWAVFTQKSTGRDFFFADTHLDDAKTTSGYNYRVTQSHQVVNEIAAHNPGNLPVILTGDMNSHKWRSPDNAPYNIFSGAGYVDPIGNTGFSRKAVRPTTEVRIHTEFDSWNNFSSKPDEHGWVNGINVDYIWVSRSITTLEYETTVNISNSTLKFIGPIPSDHNMLRAAVLIPG